MPSLTWNGEMLVMVNDDAPLIGSHNTILIDFELRIATFDQQ